MPKIKREPEPTPKTPKNRRTQLAENPAPQPADTEQEPPFDESVQVQQPAGRAVAVQTGSRAVGAPVDHFRAHQEEAKNLKAGRLFLKFAKGDWTIGKEGTEFPENEFHFVPGMDLFEKGWQCWKGGKPVDERFVAYGQPTPAEDTLPDHSPYPGENDGWQECIRFPLIIVPYGEDGNDTCYMNVEFSGSSAGGKNAIYSLSKQFSEKIKIGEIVPGETEHVLVHATHDSYMHDTYGKVYFPVFKVVACIDAKQVADLIAKAKNVVKFGGDDDAAETQPAAKGAKTPVSRGVLDQGTKATKGSRKAPAAATGNARRRISTV